MKYILSERYRLRGWKDRPLNLFDTARKEARSVGKKEFLFLLKCDGAHEIDEKSLDSEEQKLLAAIIKDEVVREAGFGEYLLPEQEYKEYPAKYRKSVHWSITGACNLKCRHCFMSAPHAKHGAPSHEEIIRIADQLAECGVFTAGLTGGEPLIREDFLEIIDALKEREIGISTIFTNGWLVDEKLLDELDRRNVHPAFQLSFDGIGYHDFLRGVEGAEERTIHALELLKERQYAVSVSMSMHRKNAPVLRETIRLLGSLGVGSVKCGSMMEIGEWASPEVRGLQLTPEEELEIFEEYIPQYFEDDAPVSIMLGGMFEYRKGDPRWGIYYHQECSREEEGAVPVCGVLTSNFFIGADGMVCPCMGMADCGYAKNFPNLQKTPLREILGEGEFTKLCETSVGQIRDHNPECRNCEHIDKCTGGCRNVVLLNGDDYYGVDPAECWFFKNKCDERITRAAEGAFEAYQERRNKKKEDPNGN